MLSVQGALNASLSARVVKYPVRLNVAEIGQSSRHSWDIVVAVTELSWLEDGRKLTRPNNENIEVAKWQPSGCSLLTKVPFVVDSIG